MNQRLTWHQSPKSIPYIRGIPRGSDGIGWHQDLLLSLFLKRLFDRDREPKLVPHEYTVSEESRLA